jgi:outer membrane protein insertion porin family
MRQLIFAAALVAAATVAPSALRAQETQGPPQVDSVEVIGNRRVTVETITAAAAIPIRQPITYRDVQRAIKALYALAQFDDVVVTRQSGAANEEILTIAVRERPLVTRVTVRGADKVSERSVSARIDIQNGRPLDPSHVAHSLMRIDSLYEQAGYYLATVRVQQIPQGDSSQLIVVLDISEGRRVAVAAMRVEGNESFSDADLVAELKTRPEGFWWFQPGEFSDARLREDLDARLPAFYASAGFIDFRILRDTLLVDNVTGKATLQIDVDEGRRYRVGTITVDGNRFLTTPQIMSLNPFVPRKTTGLGCILRSCGDSLQVRYFDQTAWEAATGKLSTLYANEGYIYADIRPQVERIEPTDSSRIGVVNLSWQISEQRPAIINRIEIVGNQVTHERIIREAIVILPGDVFRQDMILRSYQNIGNLGFFTAPMPFPDTRRANDNGDLDIIFRVEEKHTGNVNFGASVGQGAGIGGFLGLEEPNLFGLGKRAKFQWQFGRNINDFSLSYTDPSLFGSRISGTGEVHNSRVRYTVSDLGQVTSRGTSLQMGLPLPHSRYSRLFLNGGVDWESYSGRSRSLSATSRQCADCLRTFVGAQVMRDTRVDLPFPTGGSLHQIGVTLNGPLSTGTASFQRFDLEGAWYTPVARLGGGASSVGGIKLVIGLSAKAGFVTGNAGPFFRQLFAMGGTQYGIPLRGYDEFSVTPVGFNPNASTSAVSRASFGSSYFAMTAQFGARLAPQVYASVFYDAGNVWATAASFNPTRLFRSGGVGVAMITPLGPIGLDFAYGFDRTDALGRPKPEWKLHFKIGNFF